MTEINSTTPSIFSLTSTIMTEIHTCMKGKKPSSWYERLFSSSFSPSCIPLTWSHISSLLPSDIDSNDTTRETYVSFKDEVNYITEYSMEFIVNLSKHEVSFYYECYEGEAIESGECIIGPNECLFVAPNSFIETTSENNKLCVIHIGPRYDDDGSFISSPILDEIFVK